MRPCYTVGIDIGGTNTDGVLVDRHENIVASVKITTTNDISQAVKQVLLALMDRVDITADSIVGVFLGTTHAANAILQNEDLYRVGVIRISGQYPQSLPTGYGWPATLKQSVIMGGETIGGGFQCDGAELSPFEQKEAQAAIERLHAQGAESFAVIGTFSPLNSTQEETVKTLIQTTLDDAPVTLSSEVGSIGFIERENSTILNAALKKVMRKGFQKLEFVCHDLGIDCPLMITQNDGSLIDIESASEHPILTISAGPTNSFIGGARLSGLDHAVIIDIGGTSTDVGLIKNGFPVRSLNRSNIGGIPLNFPMPDVLSIAMGGGSIVDLTQEEIIIGPQSVGQSLFEKGASFGGADLTFTDIAIASGQLAILKPNQKTLHLPPQRIQQVYDRALKTIETLVMKMQGEHDTIPVVIVGGGASLIPKNQFNDRFLIPDHYDVANAYGSALSEVCGTVDTVTSIENREAVLCDMQNKAKNLAIQKGADPLTVRVIDVQITPYHYIENKMARVMVKCSGNKKSQSP